MDAVIKIYIVVDGGLEMHGDDESFTLAEHFAKPSYAVWE
jgi:hypothetical protein